MTTTTAGRVAGKRQGRAKAVETTGLVERLPAVISGNELVQQASELLEKGSEKALELKEAGEKSVKELGARVRDEQKSLRKLAVARVEQVQGALREVPVKLEEGLDVALGSVGLMRVSVHEKQLSALRASLKKARASTKKKKAA